MADQHAQAPGVAHPPRLEALRWDEPPEGPVLVVLDQRELPVGETELVCTDVPALVEAIRGYAVRGAPLLGVVGAYGVALAAARGFDVQDAAQSLLRSRPAVIGLRHGVERTLSAYRSAVEGGADLAQAASAALSEARRLHAEDADASARMASTGLTLLDELVPGGNYRILTHGNTGALASGGDGTAFAVTLSAHRAGQLRRLWVDETRPLLEGSRLTAYEAARQGMAFTLLADGAAGSLFAAGEVDAVLVGADRIAADGSVAGATGTYPLAVLAAHHRVPFVVVAPATTLDRDTPDGASLEVEQRPGQEVTELMAPQNVAAGGEAGSGMPVAPLGTQAHNPVFDVTPPELVTALVTECGTLSPLNGSGIAGLVCQVTSDND